MRLSLDEYKAIWRPHVASRARGNLIVFCGFDGSGKSTQIGLLEDRLRENRSAVISTRQPTDWYRQHPTVRDYLDSGAPADQIFLALFAAADRRQHVKTIVDPAIEAGSWVICDRYVYSSFVYFAERGLDPNFIARVNKDLPHPTLTVLLDAPAETLLQRLSTRDGQARKHEEKDLKRIERFRANFLELAKIDREIFVVDANLDPQTIHRSVCNQLLLRMRCIEQLNAQ